VKHIFKSKVFLFFLGIIGVGFIFLNIPALPSAPPEIYGVTFSPWQAQSFGLDWKATYHGLLDDLGVRRFRISAYWNTIEGKDDQFFFDDLDYQLDQAQSRGAKVILAVGRKLPRWPECHEPDFLKGASKEKMKEELLEYLTRVMERYHDAPAIWAWQVENEMFFPFGNCPNLHGTPLLSEEVKLVRSYSSKPVVISDAGEWSTWIPAALQGDILGASLYREAWNENFGYIGFPIQEGYYQIRALLLEKLFNKEVIFTEVQAEPWGPKAAQNMTAQEALQYMSVAKLQRNIAFASRVGFREVYLWGAEWWYWMKLQGDDTIWNSLREVFKEK